MGKDTLPKAICDDCKRKTYVHLLGRVRKIQERLDPDGIVPAGECPHCGALAYLEHSKHLTLTEKTQQELIMALNDAQSWAAHSYQHHALQIAITTYQKLQRKIKKVRPEI